MKVILLVLFGIFATPDGAPAPSITVVVGTDGKAFATTDECEAAWADIRSKAMKRPDLARAIGHSCDTITTEPVGQDI